MKERYNRIRTGTGSHLSALAPEPARSLLFPLLSHAVGRLSVSKNGGRDGDILVDMMSELKEMGPHPAVGIVDPPVQFLVIFSHPPLTSRIHLVCCLIPESKNNHFSMAKRQPVPAALQEELKEYSSLLRALRTSQTLDVTAHLTEPYANDDSDDEEEPGPSKSTTPAASTSTAADSSKRKRSESEPQQPHWSNRDQWTRWPIPVKDVPRPDWSLQDEIATIVKHVLATTKLKSSSPSPERDDDRDDDPSDRPLKREQNSDIELQTDSEDEGDAYYQTLAETITPVIQNKLETLFALIAAHTIARPDSMQNRIEPYDWRDLINILGSPGAAHLVDETYVYN